MAAHVTLTCDQCGHEADIELNTVEAAQATALRDFNWQHITYTYGRATFTELRCSNCHVQPLDMADQIIHREPAIDYA